MSSAAEKLDPECFADLSEARCELLDRPVGLLSWKDVHGCGILNTSSDRFFIPLPFVVIVSSGFTPFMHF